MTGLNNFINLFGQVTLSTVVELVLAGVFLYLIYKKVRDFLIERYEAEKARDQRINEALDAVHKYPEYRAQSIKIQQTLENEIQTIRKTMERYQARLDSVEETNKRRECNKLRDRLLQSYRYYTNEETNPSKSWTKMEAEAFWGLFRDYEEAGGNGYMHSVLTNGFPPFLEVVGSTLRRHIVTSFVASITNIK